MALKNIYFETWEEYVNFTKKQVENIAKKDAKSLAHWYPMEQEAQDEEQHFKQLVDTKRAVEKQLQQYPEDFQIQ